MIEVGSVLLIAPCYGGSVSDATASGIYKLTKHFERSRVRNELLLVANESLISIGRSNLASFFINCTEHSHALTLDADIGFEPEDVQAMIDLGVEYACGPYSMKTIPPRYNFAPTLRDGRLVWNEARTAVAVDHIGAGFQLIHRSAYERVARANPSLRYVPHSSSRRVTRAEVENSHHFYETYVDSVTRAAVPEDIAFCNRYRSAGGTIWMIPRLKLTHTGSHVFHGHDDLAERLLALG